MKGDWRNYQRGREPMPMGGRPMYYAGGGYLQNAPAMYPPEQFPRDRFSPGDWRPPERDYRREEYRRQQ